MRAEAILILILCYCAVFVRAQENISSIFGDAEMAEPPKLPTEGVRAELILVIRDMEQNVMGNRHVLLELENLETGTRENTLRYSDENGWISLNLEPGDWQLIAKIDDLSTPGKDYISNEFRIDLRNSTTGDLFVFPVGSLRGNVYNEIGERIVNARVRVDCGRDHGDRDTVSDEFGRFSLDYVPVGICEVLALSNNKVGSITINITKGELKTIDITLAQEVKSGPDLRILLIASIPVIVVIIFYLSRKRKPEPGIEKTTKIEITGRMRDIIRTLTDRERDIVELLIENNGKLTQAEIRHFLRIPKATMSRDIHSLKQKRIVETIKIGRNKEIILTKWFLGTEE
ncbi:MAG: hypothetical protein DRO89_04430 [Candidatus Altiarchaeales archaeon]|nr:MAG: hypothetical protein DRO89_04430 [Candidatus Altiarchaeales archaeon]